MPVVIGRNCVGENLQRQCSDGLGKAVIPKPISKSSEKKRGGLSADACERQQNASNDPPGCSLHYDVDDCFPSADTQGERSFAITIGNQQNDFFGRAQNEWNHDQSQRHTTSKDGEAFEPQYDQTVNDHTPGNRWDSIEDVSQKSQDGINPGGAVFRQVNSA